MVKVTEIGPKDWASLSDDEKSTLAEEWARLSDQERKGASTYRGAKIALSRLAGLGKVSKRSSSTASDSDNPLKDGRSRRSLLRDLSSDELAELSAEALAMIDEKIDDEIQAKKAAKAKLDAEIEQLEKARKAKK